MFMSRRDFLSGKLVISIIRNNETENITIFEGGKITDGWEPTGDTAKPGLPGEINFGFSSSKKYPTLPETS